MINWGILLRNSLNWMRHLKVRREGWEVWWDLQLVLLLFPYHPKLRFRFWRQLMHWGLSHELFHQEISRLLIQTARIQSLYYVWRRHHLRYSGCAPSLTPSQRICTPIFFLIALSEYPIAAINPWLSSGIPRYLLKIPPVQLFLL